jgi:hypothetical protein
VSVQVCLDFFVVPCQEFMFFLAVPVMRTTPLRDTVCVGFSVSASLPALCWQVQHNSNGNRPAVHLVSTAADLLYRYTRQPCQDYSDGSRCISH